MTQSIGYPWNILLGERNNLTAKKASRYDNRLKLIRSLPADIVGGEYGATLLRDNLELILEPFRNELPSQDYIFILRFLAKGLSLGRKKLQWKVAVPADLVTVPREPARFTPISFTELKRLRRIEELLANSFILTELTPRLQLGRILLSAIVYGGILQTQWLHPLISALNGRVRARETLLWLELERTWQYPRTASDSEGPGTKTTNKEILIKRRWFADPITRLLIIQWLRLPVTERTIREQLPNPYELVRQFLSFAGLPTKKIPHSVSDLFKMAGTRLGLTVPPFLAAYAEGQINAVSVPDTTWARLCSRKSVPRLLEYSGLQDDMDESERKPWRAIAYAEAPATPAEQRQILKQLRKLVTTHGGSRYANTALIRKLEDLVVTHGDILCQFLQLLTDWMIFNLRKGNASSTVSRYISASADAMLIICGNEELLEWEVGEFRARYDSAIALVKSEEEKVVTRQNFGRFHQFLVHRYGVPFIALGFFSRRSGPVETTVDANLVGQNDFDYVKLALGWNNTDRPRSATAAIIAALLGFRCGLRREEVKYLRLRDIHGRDKPELVVRPTAQRSLKTASSTRRLPLYILLTIEELQFFLHWLNQYRDPDWNTLLLGIRGNPCTPLPDAILFRPIRVALAQVTGDITLRYHHLRHSFATWLLLRLTGDPDNLHIAAPFFLHAEFHDYRIEQLRTAILGNEHLGRKGVYAVAALCGHADLETTFTSYFHLCDWFLQQQLSRPGALPFLKAETVMALTGKSRATVFRAMLTSNSTGKKEWDWETLLGNISEILPSTADHLLLSAAKRNILGIDFLPEPESQPWWDTLQRALTMHQLKKKKIDNIGTQLGIDENTVQTWLDRAAWLESLRGRVCGTTGRYYRHIEMAREDSINLPAGIKRIRKNRIRKQTRIGVFPQPPHIKADRELSLKILNTFEQLSDQDRSVVMEMVRKFIDKFSLQFGMLYFREPAKAIEFVESLRLLGIRNKNIQLIDCRNNLQGDSVVKRRRAYWEKELALKQVAWKINNKAWGTENGTGTIGVRVVREQNGKKYASYGFRYALYMIAIAHWEYGQEYI